MKANESKKAFISFHLFFRIEPFQWVAGEKMKKSRAVSGCAQNVSKPLLHPSPRTRRPSRAIPPAGI
jgi:hypothetical protein